MAVSSYLPPEIVPYLDYLPDLQRSANIFITCTPLFSYGTTCYSIYAKRTSVGFSLDICATMLMALVLRIFYYTIVPYEIALLRQLLMMVFIQCVLLKISLRYRQSNYNPDHLQPLPAFSTELEHHLPRRMLQLRIIIDHGPYSGDYKHAYLVLDGVKYWAAYGRGLFMHALKFFDVYYRRPGAFWQWLDEAPYWIFIGAFTGVFLVLTAVFHDSGTYGQSIGFLGLFIESLLPLPQILLLARLRSTKNFKVILLLSWLGGDCTKLSYLIFGTSNVLVIFLLAGLFQMSLDLLIAYQYMHFKRLETGESDGLPYSQDAEELAEFT